jgi:hypothetical protein
MNRRGRTFAAGVAPLLCASAGMADAQVTVDQNATNASNNPLTPKVTLYLQNFFMPSVVGQGDRTSDEGLARLYVPFELADTQNDLRIYAPIDTVPDDSITGRGSVRRGRPGGTSSNPAGALGGGGTDFGLGDVMAFDLIMKQIGSFGYGIGPLVVFPTSSYPNMGTGTWQAGPAVIAVQRWDWGLTGVTLTYSHSFAGPGPSVQAIGVEPLILYNLDNGFYLRSTGIWNLGFGTEPSYIPIGFGAGKVWKLPDGTTLNLHVEPQYSVWADKTGAPRWQILAGLITQF